MTEVWSFLAENLMRKMRVERMLLLAQSESAKFKAVASRGPRTIETEALLRYTQPSITQNKTDPVY
ncbi:hypothetical protein GQ600_2873 [Phytophthora cactorum]|nr:hypothetical protein GQ600_2873 [Phytophthora cactorum]